MSFWPMASHLSTKTALLHDEAKTTEVLDFYKAIAKASPQGELWKQSRELYFAGKAAMIIWSPFILDELAGLRDSAPTITMILPSELPPSLVLHQFLRSF